MIARMFIFVVVAAALYLVLRSVLAKKQLSLKQFFAIYVGALFIIVLVGLAVTGRLHPVTASLGVALTMLARSLPIIMRMFQAVNIWRAIRAALGIAAVKNGPSAGNQSHVDSLYLKMTLDHDSGELDGEVIKGSFTGHILSQMSLDQLQSLRLELEADEGSCQLLDTFLNRYYGEAASDTPPGSEASSLTTQEAEAILGLRPPYTKADVISSHRKLMQKHHPDRGGDHEFAAKLNAAKDQVLSEL